MSLRLPPELFGRIDEISKKEGRDRSEVIRELLRRGLQDKLVEDAVKLYSEGKVSMWRAAKIAGLSLWEFIELMKDKRIEIQYGVRELEEDIY